MENRTTRETFPTLTTERLTLRQLSDSDVQEIFLLRSDPSVNKYLSRQPTKTPEDALEFIEKIKINNSYYWAIISKGEEKLVGTISLFEVSDELKKCEIGYELLTEYQGKGLMREAAIRVIEYISQTLDFNTVDAYTHRKNLNSANLLHAMKFIPWEQDDTTNSDLMVFRLNISRK